MSRRYTPEKFWANVEKTDNHWYWLGTLDDDGYGQLCYQGRSNSSAHRIAWELTRGHPGKLWVLHRCDTPACVNPAHLFLGTQQDNSRDMVAKGRSLTGERNPNAKLSWPVVCMMRAKYWGGEATQEELARENGIDQTTASEIVMFKRWNLSRLPPRRRP